MLISLIMPFYRNSGMLALQYENWASWPADLKAAFELIIVDDGSPEPAIDVPRPEGLPQLSIFRVLEDRPWHQHAARNLGAQMARAEWMLLTDMDHMLTAENADTLREQLWTLDPETAFFLHRVEADTFLPTLGTDQSPKPHPNSFVMTHALYWQAGGYDEDYCGIYGTDGLFKARLFSIAQQGLLADVALKRYWRDLIPDASTDAPRKEGRDPNAKREVAERKRLSGREGIPTVLNFPWRRVL